MTISRTTMNKQMKGNKMPITVKAIKPKKKIGDDLVEGTKKFFGGLFGSSDKKVPSNKKSPYRKYSENKKATKDKTIKSQKESTKFMGNKANATVDPRIVKKAKPNKGPVVTEEQLKKSGLSLRDYMNFQQNKTRNSGPVVPQRVAPGVAVGNTETGDKKRNEVVNKNYGGSVMKKSYGGSMSAKKPVQRKNIGKMLETLSPAYSMMKGKGPASSILSAIGGSGLGGPGAIFAKQQRDKAGKKQDNRQKAAQIQQGLAAQPASGMAPAMRKGGRVRKIDGIASRGKTRAR
jgi:hypothetical protein